MATFLLYANYKLPGRYLKDKQRGTITRLMIRFELNHLRPLSLSTYFIVLVFRLRKLLMLRYAEQHLVPSRKEFHLPDGNLRF